MFGLAILVLTTVGTAVASLSILGHPGGLWLALALAGIANAVAAVGVARRAAWGRRIALAVLGAEIVVVAILMLVAIVFFLAVSNAFGANLVLGLLVVVPMGIGALAAIGFAITSINQLEWPDAC